MTWHRTGAKPLYERTTDGSVYWRISASLGEINELMMTSSNGKKFRLTVPMCGEFTGPGKFPTQRPVTRSFDVFFDLRLNKRLSKQPWGWWFETPSWSLWRQSNVLWWCRGACSAPSHYLNLWLLLANWTIRSKYSELYIKINIFRFKKIHLNLPTKWKPILPGRICWTINRYWIPRNVA